MLHMFYSGDKFRILVTENPTIKQMILFAEHVLIVFYVFQIVRSIVNDDSLFVLARKCFEFLVILFILGQATYTFYSSTSITNCL